MKSRSILKRIMVIFALIAVVFGGINLFWYGFKYLPYRKMADHMNLDDDSEMPRYVVVDDNYIYRVFIWPQMFSETKYGLTIYEETYSMQVMINSLGEYLPGETVSEDEKTKALELIEKHKDEIQDILHAADELLGGK